MKHSFFKLLVVLFLMPLLANANNSIEEASEDQVLELTSVLSLKREPEVENALRNSIEYTIWSLEERRTLASNRALSNLVAVRLGESTGKDRDCAIIKRGSPMAALLKSPEALVRWCTTKTSQLNLKVTAVCMGVSETKQSADLLLNAIRKGKRCEN